MKPYIFIFKTPDKDGKFIFTEDELKEILEKVYNDAYNEGLKAINWWSPTVTYTGTNYQYQTPNTTGTPPPPNPYQYQVTCEVNNTVGD